MTDGDPLILTLRFDAASFAIFDEARRAHFPKERNIVPAHLTLFHKLPADEEDRIRGDLRHAASETGLLPLRIGDVRFLGYGSAYVVQSAALRALRADLARSWTAWLSPQDAQAFSGHVTIQNKVPAPQAKAFFQTLKAEFEPFEALATGLLLWRYRSGPWEAVGEYAFSG